VVVEEGGVVLLELVQVPVCRSRDVCTQGRKGVAESSGEFTDRVGL